MAARKGGLDRVAVAGRSRRRDTVACEWEREHRTTLRDGRSGKAPVVYLKGGPERVLPRCEHALGPGGGSVAIDPAVVLAQVERLAGEGLRVLAIERASAPPGTAALERALVDQGGYTLLGLEAMLDPPRPEAVAAVARCRAAGIAVKMITGDHVATARTIGGRLRLTGDADDGAPPALSGEEVAALDERELAAAVETTSVFARVAPEQKLRLVVALQRLSLIHL